MAVRSVIYLLTPGETIDDQAAVAAAQSLAVKQQLPFAVVYCLETPDESAFVRLSQLEAQLADYAIPLMVLIGEPDKRLAWLESYIEPQKYTKDSFSLSGDKLKLHPVRWPGVIIPVKELTELVDNNKLMC